MATWICVNIGSGNSLLSDDIKQLPEPMSTYDDMRFFWRCNFTRSVYERNTEHVIGNYILKLVNMSKTLNEGYENECVIFEIRCVKWNG